MHLWLRQTAVARSVYNKLFNLELLFPVNKQMFVPVICYHLFLTFVIVTIMVNPGAVFKKGLSQVLGLSWLYFYTKVKPKTWLRPFVNTAPDVVYY